MALTEPTLDTDIAAGKRYDSRKYRLAQEAMVAIVVGGLVAAVWPAFSTQYTNLIMGICGVLTIYYGGNLGNKFVLGNATGPVAHATAANIKTPPISQGGNG